MLNNINEDNQQNIRKRKEKTKASKKALLKTRQRQIGFPMEVYDLGHTQLSQVNIKIFNIGPSIQKDLTTRNPKARPVPTITKCG